LEIDSAKTRALLMLVAGRKIEEIAIELSVTTRTIHNWKKDPEFQKYYKDALRQILDGAVAELALYSQKASQELINIINDPDVPAKIKISAISCLFSNLSKMKEEKPNAIEINVGKGISEDTAAYIRAKVLGMENL
jgi:predicted transcriptional regulator